MSRIFLKLLFKIKNQGLKSLEFQTKKAADSWPSTFKVFKNCNYSYFDQLWQLLTCCGLGMNLYLTRVPKLLG